MIQHEFDSQIESFIRYTNTTLKKILAEEKEVLPSVFLLIYSGKDAKFGIMPVAVDPAYFNTPDAKDTLARYVLPHVIHKVNMSGSRVVCFCLAMEAWVTAVPMPAGIVKMSSDEYMKYAIGVKDQYEKQERLFITYETELTSRGYSYPIIRVGDQVSAGKETIVETPTDANARFQNILRRQVSRN